MPVKRIDITDYNTETSCVIQDLPDFKRILAVENGFVLIDVRGFFRARPAR